MENDIYYCEITIKKLKELENAIVPNNIEEGYVKVLTMPTHWFKEPIIGEPFVLGSYKTGRYFRTSIVTEIIDESTFKTLNSIYRWSKSEQFK